MLYHDEEGKMKVQSLPELEREMIIAEQIDKIKQIAEMSIAFILANHRHSN